MSKAIPLSFHIRGLVLDSKTRRGIDGLRVEAWDKDLIFDDLVGSTVTDAQGAFQIAFDESYFKELFFDRRPDLFFKVYRDDCLVASTEDSVLWNVERGETEVTIEVDLSTVIEHPAERRSVEGQVFFDNGLPAASITLRFYSRGFGGAETRLGEVKADDRGFYALTYDSGGEQVNLEARMVDHEGKEVPLSAVKYNAERHEVLNLIAPSKAAPLAPEYDRLTADLIKQLGDLNKLADARENAERQDLTFLHQATGWDARLIALAAIAVRLQAETGIRHEVLYALFRVGFPTVKQQLVLASGEAMETALRKAAETSIVGLSVEQIAAAKEEFESFAVRIRSDVKPAGTLSGFGGLLARSALTDAEKKVFEDLYFANLGAGAELWQKAREQGLSAEKIDNLRLQGKLAYLTLNNANLVSSLHQEIDSTDNLAQLVEMDFHQSDTWKARLNSLAGDEQALEKLIPPAYAGEKTADRLDSYAADLARRVRISFPTQVVARMMEKGELHLGNGDEAADVQTFLRSSSALGFELGRMPVDKFVRENHETLFPTDTPPEKVEATTEGVKKLQRLYQITPSNESLKAVLDLGFSSAHEVTALTYDDFVDRVGDRFPSREEAQLVYRKAQQVSAVTHNLLVAAKQLDRTPALYAISPSAERREEAIDNLMAQYPKMESLFGSLDFCECEQCRSVLSPAAYLVDLLLFLDPDTTTWESFLEDWHKKHNQAPYPFKDQFEWENFNKSWENKHHNQEYPFTEKKPYEVLVERRPDLPHLPLTCENTQTVLPYIDLVNEILEFYVANDGLDETAVRDSGDATTEELLAEPQNILPKAYQALKDARYPLSLPFDLWLETVRRFFVHFETPFWQALEIFRPSDDLYAPGQNPKPYYRADIFAEYLGLSPSEFAIFTDGDPLAKWHLLYGFDDSKKADDQNQKDARAALKSARTLAQRLGVSYKELVELLRTAFINQRLEALVILEKLGVSVDDVFRYKENEALLSKDKNKLLGEELELRNELESFGKRLDDLTNEFGFDARAWLDQAWTNSEFSQILLLLDTGAGCNFDKTALLYSDHKNDYLQNKDVHEINKDAYSLVFLKINLFVRLWRKLGWTIEETDRALQVFLPKNSDLADATKLGEAMKTALLYLAHFKALDERFKGERDHRQRLLTLSSNLATTGQNPLYAHLFLTPGALKHDPIFDQPLGKYLRYLDSNTNKYQPFHWDDTTEDVKTGNVGLKNHLFALQGGLNLSANEIERILEEAGKDLSKAELSLDNVSLLYRYGLLAKALKLSVSDLIALKELSGLNAFETLEPDPIKELEKDYPFSQTLRFIEVAEKVRDSGFKIEDLDYLLRHRFDPIGKYRPDPDGLIALVKTLGTSIHRIQIEHSAPEDLSTLNDDLLRQRLGLVLPPDVVDRFLGILAGTTEFEVVQDKVDTELDAKAFAGNSALRVSYDPIRKIQRLSYRGMLSDARKKELSSGNPQLLSDLLDAVQRKAATSFAAGVENIVGLLTATVEYEAIQRKVDRIDKLDPESFKADPIRVSYDESAKTQWLAYRGLLLNEKKSELETKNQSHVLANLLGAVQSQAREFCNALLEAALGMLLATVDFKALQENVSEVDSLDPAMFVQEPAIRVSYDKRGQTQLLIYHGALTDAKEAELNPSNKALLANLLNATQGQARTFVKSFRLAFLTASDFDLPFNNLDDLADTSERSKAKLAKAILPFIEKKLVRQSVAQTMASTLNADPALTETLLTDASLLSDPSQPAESLLDGFAAAGNRGVTLLSFASADGTGAPFESGTAITVDSNPKAVGAKSARFEGFLEVPAAGSYRFFVLFDKKGVEAEFRLGVLPDPVIHHQAIKDNDEDSRFVELRSGVIYRFKFEAHNLDKGDVRLSVQGENLPKGSLDRLTLYPDAAVERFRRAHVLLAKTLQLVQGFSLNEREVRYLLTHATDFDNLDLSKLPTREASLELEAIARKYQEIDPNLKKEDAIISARNDYPDLAQEADDAAAKGNALFKQFLRLADYARLKRDLAVDGDELISVFETKLPGDAYKRVAALTRRDENTVEATATQLQLLKASDFANEKGLGRLWPALQLVEKLGAAVDAITRSTEIISETRTSDEKFALAQELRNAVKSRYESENWQRIAQPIFDRLRQRQRDALSSCIMHRLGFERIEQLFEYFLIDPAMEPVVQTSRLRLAISSVQTFIQRCFLNLEPEVDASALNSNHWQWMKGYRVWEANRKLFLFCENWLEPEFRDDKTHLFQELEGALLQGDVSNDLAEDAFFTYLNKLEDLAQLEMVTMYIEEKPDPESNILHLIGRTPNLPHKYFYRRYAHQMWTPWEPVTAEIEGDHVVAVVWRDRLHLFWVTFMEKGKLEPNQEKKTIAQLADTPVSGAVQEEVAVQLNWSESFQGQWSTRKSSSFDNPMRVMVPASSFESSSVFIRVVREQDDKGEEGGLQIFVTGLLTGSVGILGYFNVLSKNSQPEPWSMESSPQVKEYAKAFLDILQKPYSATTTQPTRFSGSGTLQVTFVNQIETEEGKTPQSNEKAEDILRPDGVFFLLRDSNLLEFAGNEMKSVVRPFFYQDQYRTFLVEPTLVETTTQHWEDYGVTNSVAGAMFGNLVDISHQAQVPFIGDPPLVDWVGNYAIQPGTDWLGNSAALLEFDGRLVGQGGGVAPLTGLPAGGGINVIGGAINSISFGQLNGHAFGGATLR